MNTPRDIPDTVQWVLDFLNINSIPGKPNPWKLPITKRNLKRPPIPQDLSNLQINHNSIIDTGNGYQWRIVKKPTEEIDYDMVKKQLSEVEAKEIKLKVKIMKLVKKYPDLKQEWEKKIKELETIKETVPKQNELELKKRLDLNKDIEFEGINTTPSLKDFKEFFLKTGIPPVKGKELLLENDKPLSSLNIKSYTNRPKNNSEPGFYNYYYDRPPIELTFDKRVANTQHELSRILANLVWNTKTYDNGLPANEVLQSYMRTIRNLYLEWWKEDELPADDGETFDGKKYRGRYSLVIDSMDNKKPFPHYGMIPHAIYACILDFGINHKELHSRLRQCQCCGSFWIEEKNRKGRPSKYCSIECEDRFNQQSRGKDISNKKRHRQKKSTWTKNEIVTWLTKKHHEQNKDGVFRFVTKERAEEIYNNLPKKAKTSLKDFNKNWAKPNGYEIENI